jgi:DNA-binding transcriptional ArsR family regulator
VSGQPAAPTTDGALDGDRPVRDQQALAKAMSSPTRLRIMALLNEGVASPKQLADRLGEPLENVSYHVRVLRELDCIELVSTRPRRGATEHFYRATTRAFIDNEGSAGLDESVRAAMSSTVLQEIFRLAYEATSQGTFDSRSDRHLSYVNLELTEAGWCDVGERLDALLEHAMGLQAEALAAGDDEQIVKSTLTLAHFPSPRAT